MDERAERAPIGILEAAPDGTVTAVNETAGALLDTDHSATGQSIEALFPESVDNTVPGAFDGAVSEQLRVEEYYPALESWFEVTIVPGGETVTVYLEDITGYKRDEQSRQALESDLNRLTIINELISDILAELVGASSREEIARTISTRLGETDIYEFAWIGERELGGEDIVVRAAAGSTGRTLDQIEESLDGRKTPPEQRVVETGEPTIIADGLQSLLAIPLTYGSSVHGVVGIYAADRDAFSERERASFETLGEMAGFAVNAARNRNLLLSDSIVELTIELRDTEAPLCDAATGREATLNVDGVVPQGDDPLLCYLVVEDGSPNAVADALDDHDRVVSTRVIGDHGETGSIEVGLNEETPLGHLASHGVTIADAEFASGRGRVVTELSPEEDVRRIATALTRRYDAEVVAKRERDRSIRTAQAFRDDLSERLTGRQESALRTAFFANYFESPRGSTAAEVGEALDITGPTLLHHLRAGQRKLLSEFFETGGDRRP
ncbi:histidine kinase [Halobacteriales archaeon QS_4_66_20]|nr:MAG: histidine kinase [Halobacteriales archaeon QS_4_66_20]